MKVYKDNANFNSILSTLILVVLTFGVGSAMADSHMVKDPSTGEMITDPKYGGTIRPIVNFKVEGIDPYVRYTAGAWIGLVNEKLGIGDWAIDRDVFSYNTLYLPVEVIAGQLAESWETPDPLTFVFKIRQGIKWHDKAPVNGRPLTAHDVAYSWQRLLGFGGGEPGKDVVQSDIGLLPLDSVTATDDHTVVFKYNKPYLDTLRTMLIGLHGFAVAREVVEQFGGVGKAVLGYFMPYEEWPEEVKQYYRFDPEAAEKLLDEAGYPRGEDGVRFKTIYEHYEFFDLGYYQIAMDYLRQIGIDFEIQAITRNDMIQKALKHEFLGMRSDVWAAEYQSATATIAMYWSQNRWRPVNINDAMFDEYYENALNATTAEEQKKWMRMADMRVTEQLWSVRGPISPLFGATQPWIKGYNGEGELGAMNRVNIFIYMWVDKM